MGRAKAHLLREAGLYHLPGGAAVDEVLVVVRALGRPWVHVDDLVQTRRACVTWVAFHTISMKCKREGRETGYQSKNTPGGP